MVLGSIMAHGETYSARDVAFARHLLRSHPDSSRQPASMATDILPFLDVARLTFMAGWREDIVNSVLDWAEYDASLRRLVREQMDRAQLWFALEIVRMAVEQWDRAECN